MQFGSRCSRTGKTIPVGVQPLDALAWALLPLADARCGFRGFFWMLAKSSSCGTGARVDSLKTRRLLSF